MSSGRGSLIFWGFVNFTYVFLFSVLLPYWTLTALNNITIAGISISFGQENFFAMTVWLLRAGIIMAAFAFFKASSPKYSRRKALAGLFETSAEIFYIFMYRFSGTSNIHIHGPNIFVNLDLTQFLGLYMGMIFMYVLYNIWDLIDTQFFARERAEKDIKKQMEKKWKKLMKKKDYVPRPREAQATNNLSGVLASNKTPTTTTSDNKKEGDFLD